MTNEHALNGCTPTPLASYLKALAVLRLVVEQGADPEATGCWRDDEFHLRTRLTEDELASFFLEKYEPTPLAAPWNGGSGFYPKDNQDGIKPLLQTTNPRFQAYKEALQSCRIVVKEISPKTSPKEKQKAIFLARIRNEAPELFLRWMDAAVLLTAKDAQFPPLLGTGGNDGRLDFTNNFMQRLGELFDIKTGCPVEGAALLLENAIWAGSAPGLSDNAIGQFSPGSAGGPNAGNGFKGAALVNPWDFVLMLEGVLWFAASVVRRLESLDQPVMSAPFTVRSRAGTSGSGSMDDDAGARGEIWMPLWNQWAGAGEVAALLGEGRVAVGGKPARDGLDFARAVSRLGMDRGISQFQRFGFLNRSGKAFLATPLNRMAARRNPQADLLMKLDCWLGQVRKYANDDYCPVSFRSEALRLDKELFAMVERLDKSAVEKVLCGVGATELLCATGPRMRKTIRPLPPLSVKWAERANDGSAEFHVAAALASLSFNYPEDGRERWFTMRRHLAPVGADGPEWDENSRHVVWGPGALVGNLTQTFKRRRLDAMSLDRVGETLAAQWGASLADVLEFVEGRTDDDRISRLLSGLVCVNLKCFEPLPGKTDIVLPPAYVLLKPFFMPESRALKLLRLPEKTQLRFPAEIPVRLASGDVEKAVEAAWSRLRAAGREIPGRKPPGVFGVEGARLLAALMIPLSRADEFRLARCLDVILGKEKEEASHGG